MTIRQGHNVIAGSSGRQLQDAFPLFFDHRFTFDPQDIRWVNSEDYSWLDGEVYRGGYNKLLSQYQPTGMFKAASLNYTCVFSDLSIVETNVPVATGTITDLQDWATAAGYTTTGTTIKELVVQKSLVSSSETIAEVVISFYRCYDKKKIVLTDQIAAVEAIYAATGVAEYFILDIANKQFKLPRNKWGKYGTGSGDLGDYISESVPNVRGSLGYLSSNCGSSSGATDSGALYWQNPASQMSSRGSTTGYGFDVGFNASRSSSAYKDGAPVQPRGAKGDLYFYLGDSDADIVGKAYVTDALIQSKANNSEVLHKTLNESFTGTKTGYGVNTPIALKRNGTYTEIQTQDSNGIRTGGFRNIQETDSTVNQTIMYVADGSSYKGDIAINYDTANNAVWASLPYRLVQQQFAYEKGTVVTTDTYLGRMQYSDKNGSTIVEDFNYIAINSNKARYIKRIHNNSSSSATGSVDILVAEYDGTTAKAYTVTPASAALNNQQIATTAHVINVLKLMYPVGSVYIGTQSTCPMGQLFGTWDLVSSGKALWTGNGSNGNATINAGLPNITGSISLHGVAEPNIIHSATGAFSGIGGSTTQYRTPANMSVSSGAVSSGGFAFNASDSNDIFGKSSTVQPPAYVVNVWRRTA